MSIYIIGIHLIGNLCFGLRLPIIKSQIKFKCYALCGDEALNRYNHIPNNF